MGAIGNSEKRKTTRDHATKMLNTALIPDTMVKTTSHVSNPPDVFDKLTGDQQENIVSLRVSVRARTHTHTHTHNIFPPSTVHRLEGR